jgi:hypothetical protein
MDSLTKQVRQLRLYVGVLTVIVLACLVAIVLVTGNNALNKGREPGRRYKECWIGLGPTYSRVYRLETSMEEYLAFTSDQAERVLIEQYAGQYENMQLGIMALRGNCAGMRLQVERVDKTEAGDLLEVGGVAGQKGKVVDKSGGSNNGVGGFDLEGLAEGDRLCSNGGCQRIDSGLIDKIYERGQLFLCGAVPTE